MWAVAPTDGYGGYATTFPKGKLDGLSPRATAIKEAFEESGLRVELTGYLCDIVRTTSVTRYYTARSVGGKAIRCGHLDGLAADISSQSARLMDYTAINPIVGCCCVGVAARC